MLIISIQSKCVALDPHAATCEHTDEITAGAEHTWGEGVVTKEATTREIGHIEYTCKICNATKEFSYINQVPEDAVSLDELGAKKQLTDADLEIYGISATSIPAKIADATYYKFGVYPQTVKAESVEIDETIINLEFDAVDYYLGSDNNWYAKYNDKYYKVEPIVWRKLGSSGCLLAEKALTGNVPYYGSKEERTLNETTIYANNYKYSNIRAFLNGTKNQFVTDGGTSNFYTIDWSGKDFLQTAFTEKQREQIKDTTIDNNAASTTDAEGNLTQATDYACENTTDKIFLLSELEATTTANGFATYNQSGNSRIRVATDYAKANANNVYLSGSKGKGCYWWLRSPHYYSFSFYTYSYMACNVYDTGAASGGSGVNLCYGVVPALNLIAE